MPELCMHEVVRCTICHEPDRSGDGPAADSRPFHARFSGTCRGCGFEIKAGDLARFVNDQVVHDICTKEARRG